MGVILETFNKKIEGNPLDRRFYRFFWLLTRFISYHNDLG